MALHWKSGTRWFNLSRASKAKIVGSEAELWADPYASDASVRSNKPEEVQTLRASIEAAGWVQLSKIYLNLEMVEVVELHGVELRVMRRGTKIATLMPPDTAVLANFLDELKG